MRIGHLGPYSIDNAGDVLVGLATRHAIRNLSTDAELVVFAPKVPHAFWKHDFSRARGVDAEIIPVDSLAPMTWASEVDALVIGGGGLISSEPHFATFLLRGDPAWRRHGPPAAWNAVGAQNEPWYAAEFAAIYAVMRTGAEQLTYASVRNRSTERFLRKIGVRRHLEIVPDPALLMPACSPEQVQAVHEKAGLTGDRFRIGVSIGNSIDDPRARTFHDQLFACLDQLAEREQVEVVVFPFGNVYGDCERSAKAASALRRAHHVTVELSPVELWTLIGSLDLYVGTRFHAILAAYAQDVPLVILDEYLSDAVATSKLRELAIDCSLEPYYLSPWLSLHPARKVVASYQRARAGAISFADDLVVQRERLDDHYRTMLGALGVTITPRA